VSASPGSWSRSQQQYGRYPLGSPPLHGTRRQPEVRIAVPEQRPRAPIGGAQPFNRIARPVCVTIRARSLDPSRPRLGGGTHRTNLAALLPARRAARCGRSTSTTNSSVPRCAVQPGAERADPLPILHSPRWPKAIVDTWRDRRNSAWSTITPDRRSTAAG
jgi:hypothetical protein